MKIELREWHYQCGDKCCDLYGTQIYIDGEEVGEQYDGDNVENAITAILTHLKLDFEVTRTCE